MSILSKKIIKVASSVVVIIILCFFIFRNPILHYVVDKVVVKMKREKSLVLNIGKVQFSGLSTISFANVAVIPESGDTLLKADSLSIRPSLWTLFTGTIRIKEVEASGTLLQIVKKRDSNNYSFVHQEKQNVGESKKTSNGFAAFFASLLDKAFNLAPQKAEISNASFRFVNDTLQREVRLNKFHSDVASVNGEFEDLYSHNKWLCNGSFSQTAHKFDMFVFPVSDKANLLPLTTELAGAAISFDSLHIELDGYRYSNGELEVNGLASIDQFAFHHKRISEDTIKIQNASISYSISSDKNSVMLDSSSVATLSDIKFKPFVRYEFSDGKKYSLKVKTDSIPGTSFFNSLPEGMFDEVRSIEADGSLQFNLDFFLNSLHPDDVVFECSMKKNKFRIKKFNNSDLMKMNGEFSQTVYENDRYIRSFYVGSSNPSYTPYEFVSPYFRNSVLTSEDGNFFFHNGFNEDAFRKSIATNYKAKKFLRGGSTISMQLVKNVYLNRKKTIARKAEEALIVWLIESNRLFSKERMLEVYFNIIELGPNIYGIGEASQFYFKKSPSSLSLPESIFLASLLPHPKWFKYSFDTTGNLKPYLSSYYHVMSNFMLRKELITQQEFDNLLPNVQITGPARELIVPSDTIPENDDDVF